MPSTAEACRQGASRNESDFRGLAERNAGRLGPSGLARVAAAAKKAKFEFGAPEFSTPRELAWSLASVSACI